MPARATPSLKHPPLKNNAKVSFAPLIESGWLITLHASTALMSLVLGVLMFARPKGTLAHRTLG